MEITVCDRSVGTVSALIHALFDSAERFFRRGGYDILTDSRKESQLFAFLCDLGYRQTVQDCYAQMSQMKNEGDKMSEIMYMLEVIAGPGTEEETLVQNFYRNFGPVGVSRYVQQLVLDPTPVYRSVNADGKLLLDGIARFEPESARTVPELRRAYSPLAEKVLRMRAFLEDNPYDIVAGIYGDGDILCVNLKGCFGFWLYDTAAPLGFESWISSNGGDSV